MSLGIFAHTPLHSEQAVEQVIPCFLQEQRMVLQAYLQPQRTTSRNFWGAGCRTVMIDSKFPALTFQPQYTEDIWTPNHFWIWWYTLRLWYLTKPDVWGSSPGWTGTVLVATFIYNFSYLRTLIPWWGLPLYRQTMAVSPAEMMWSLLAPWLMKTFAWSLNWLSDLIFDIYSFLTKA